MPLPKDPNLPTSSWPETQDSYLDEFGFVRLRDLQDRQPLVALVRAKSRSRNERPSCRAITNDEGSVNRISSESARVLNCLAGTTESFHILTKRI